MAVFLGRGVDLRRKTPRRENKVRAPIIKGPPVDLTRKKPRKRKTFFDQEDVTFAMLAGPHSLKLLFQEGQEEIQKIHNEMEDLYSKFLPKANACSWEYQISTFWDCDDSPFGLCMYHKFEDPAFDCCVFCGEPNERK